MQPGRINCHIVQEAREETILGTPGSGVALLDYDNDGWLDIYLLNARRFPHSREGSPAASMLCATTMTERSPSHGEIGVGNERWAWESIGRLDNGWLAGIYVSNFGKNRLYHNNHNGTFTDVAETPRDARGWSTGATWGDYDHDGYLDLFVPGYAKFDPDNPPIAGKGPSADLPVSGRRLMWVRAACGRE